MMGAQQDGPEVVLTAEAPSADFLVRVCYSGPLLESADMGFSAVARTSSPGFETGPDVVLESSGPTVQGEEEGFDSYEAVLGTTLDVDLGDDEESFVDTNFECTENTMVHMAVVGDFQPGQEVHFDWTVHVLMRYEQLTRITLRDRHLEIEIDEV